jgi:ribosomal protein S18 acetylase RimI-like enzyme
LVRVVGADVGGQIKVAPAVPHRLPMKQMKRDEQRRKSGRRARAVVCCAIASRLAMTASTLPRELDNPFWSSLVTRHAHLAQGGALARRYPSAISRIAGLPDARPANIAALEALVDIGDDMGTAGPFVPRLRGNWETLHESRLVQMVRTDCSLLPEDDVQVSVLGPADVPQMLELVDIAQPGPFRPRTIELGTYLGIRAAGRLVAMAGERLWLGDFHEVSAVCTHPDAQGRGYARALMSRIVNRMLRAGETPFLHVRSTNARAMAIYRALGFVRRLEYPLLYAKRLS